MRWASRLIIDELSAMTNPMSSSSSSPLLLHSGANVAANESVVSKSVPLETSQDSGDDLLVVINNDPLVLSSLITMAFWWPMRPSVWGFELIVVG